MLDVRLKQDHRHGLRLRRRGCGSNRLEKGQLRQPALAAAAPAPDIIAVRISSGANHAALPSAVIADFSQIDLVPLSKREYAAEWSETFIEILL